MGPGAVIFLFLFVGIFLVALVGFLDDDLDFLHLQSLFSTTVTDATNCVGTWSGCADDLGSGSDASCQKTYSVTTAASDGGTPCPASDGDTKPCAEVVQDSGSDMCDNYVPGQCTNYPVYDTVCSTGGPNSITLTNPTVDPGAGCNRATISCDDPCVLTDPKLSEGSPIVCMQNYDSPYTQTNPQGSSHSLPGQVTQSRDIFGITEDQTTYNRTNDICQRGYVPVYFEEGAVAGRILTDQMLRLSPLTLSSQNTLCRKMCACGTTDNPTQYGNSSASMRAMIGSDCDLDLQWTSWDGTTTDSLEATESDFNSCLISSDDIAAAEAAGCSSAQYYATADQSLSGTAGCVTQVTSCDTNFETLGLYGNGTDMKRTPNGTLLKNGTNTCTPNTIYCGCEGRNCRLSDGVYAQTGSARCLPAGGAGTSGRTIIPVNRNSGNIDTALGDCPQPTDTQNWKLNTHNRFSILENTGDFAHGITNIATDDNGNCEGGAGDGGDDSRCTLLKCTYAGL